MHGPHHASIAFLTSTGQGAARAVPGEYDLAGVRLVTQPLTVRRLLPRGGDHGGEGAGRVHVARAEPAPVPGVPPPPDDPPLHGRLVCRAFGSVQLLRGALVRAEERAAREVVRPLRRVRPWLAASRDVAAEEREARSPARFAPA